MSSYVLTPSAERDFAGIVAYVETESHVAAERLVADLVGAFERLAEFPRLGHVRTALMASEARFWVVRPYLIVYRAGVTPIEILRIISGHRDLIEQLTWGVSEAVEESLAVA
jgi:toxin ParE1/3/4